MPFAYTGRMFVIGRGVEFATAREIALKLLETCRVAAEPLTATDLAHGPVAALDPLFPVWAIASPDATLAGGAGGRAAHPRDGRDGRRERHRRGLDRGQPVRRPGPGADEPLLSPLLSVVPGQLFAGALARPAGSTRMRRTG